MAGKSFFGRIMGRNQSETQAAVPMSQVNSAPQNDKTYEFNTRLGSSYLNVVNYGTKCTAPYSTEEITRMARDPMQYISELRQWAKWAYYSNGTVTTAIDSLVSLHSLDYVVVVKPKKAGGSRKGYRASMDKMTSVLRSMRYKEVIRDGLFHDANEGMYVGYMETRTVPVDDRLALTDLDIQGITEINSAGVNCVVISLPVEYTRIIGRRNNCYEVAFDLRYFSAMTEGDRKRKLQGFPRQIQEGWRRYSNGEFPDGACWQRLDWRKTIALQRLCNAVSGLVPEPEKGSRTVKEVDLLSFLVSRIARSTRVKLKPSLNSYQRCLGCSILAEKFGIQSSPYECSQTAFIVSMTFTLYQ